MAEHLLRECAILLLIIAVLRTLWLWLVSRLIAGRRIVAKQREQVRFAEQTWQLLVYMTLFPTGMVR
jgi:hypothetical protein